MKTNKRLLLYFSMALVIALGVKCEKDNAGELGICYAEVCDCNPPQGGFQQELTCEECEEWIKGSSGPQVVSWDNKDDNVPCKPLGQCPNAGC